MSIQQDFRDMLLEIPAISGLFGDRIFWCMVPQGAKMPFACFSKSGIERMDRSISGTETRRVRKSAIEIISYARKAEEAAAAAELLATTLENGHDKDRGIQRIELIDEQDFQSPNTLERGIFAVAQTYQVTHLVTVTPRQ